MSVADLKHEWRRVEILCDILQSSRRGEIIAESRIAALEAVQNRVRSAREKGVWDDIVGENPGDLAVDILACAAAPDLSHVAAHAYQGYTGDASSPYPTLHLLQALLSLEPEDMPDVHAALSASGPLRRRRLLAIESNGASPRLVPSRRLRQHLTGHGDLVAPPGSMPVLLDAGWEDLILPDLCRRMLGEYLNYVSHGKIVAEQWMGAVRGGPVALFSGPSGTGKTLAASVIASEIGWPLYRVDLGRLVSKYIGETEKNLNALFDATDGASVVLLFDEADTLFGKRGEVKEARDRYANMEVSHLLARIENHAGPCILTTNLRTHLDSAFLRRFQMVIDFPRPDAAARLELWRRHIPARAPLAPDVDLGSIARAVGLTGAGIANAALHAAHMAASRDTAISMELLTLGIWRELGKSGGALSLSDLGPLASHLKEQRLAEDRQNDAATAA